MESINDFDNYVLDSIFSHLNLKFKLKCKMVCSRWNKCIGIVTITDKRYKRVIAISDLITYTPQIILEIGSANGIPELVKYALKLNVDNIGRAIDLACRYGHLNIIKLFIIKSNKKWFELFASDLRSLLDPQSILNYYMTIACRYNHTDLMKYFISLGASRCYHCKRDIKYH